MFVLKLQNMAKREQMFRLMNISNFLKSKPRGVTFRDIVLFPLLGTFKNRVFI